MKRYYFFSIDDNNQREYGEEYHVMADSIQSAIDYIKNHYKFDNYHGPKWIKIKSFDDLLENKMGCEVFTVGQVTETELS